MTKGSGGRWLVCSTGWNRNSPVFGSWLNTKSPTRIFSMSTAPVIVQTGVPATKHSIRQPNGVREDPCRRSGDETLSAGGPEDEGVRLEVASPRTSAPLAR